MYLYKLIEDSTFEVGSFGVTSGVWQRRCGGHTRQEARNICAELNEECNLDAGITWDVLEICTVGWIVCYINSDNELFVDSMHTLNSAAHAARDKLCGRL